RTLARRGREPRLALPRQHRADGALRPGRRAPPGRGAARGTRGGMRHDGPEGPSYKDTPTVGRPFRAVSGDPERRPGPMLLHKLRAAAHLAWLLLGANLLSVAGSVRRGPRAALRELRHAAVRLSLGAWAVVAMRGKFRVARIVRLCLASGVPRSTLERNLEAAVALAERDIGRQKFERA